MYKRQYKAVRPLVFRLQRQIEEIFIDASADLGNMHGRQRQFSLGFIGLVLYYIVMKQETSKREDCLLYTSSAAMEEKRAENPDNFDTASIVNVKTALMGPMAAIGDTLFHGCLLYTSRCV